MTDNYVPVASDDWYQRRRDDAEGKFFRHVADQGPRNGVDGSTRQGIYCFAASGKLLVYKNSAEPEVMRDFLQKGLAAWKKLPASERQPGAVRVPELDKPDPRYDRQPPENGLIINVFTRTLDREPNGSYRDSVCEVGEGDDVARDHLWLKESEWRSLIPEKASEGDKVSVPAAIAERIFRFHLVDNTRGEPPFWQREEIRSGGLALIVKGRDASGMTLRLEGSILLATAADPKEAQRGYETNLSGYIHYATSTKSIDRFELLAIGEHWGEGTYTPGARPGRTPLGIAFEMIDGNSAANRVPPQGIRMVHDYFGR